MGKVDNNKQQKRDSLLESAFSLFINNGFTKTSISDIVKQAGVAKGTFYLYFKNKYDIRNHLIAHKASQVFQNAYHKLQNHPEITDFENQILFIIDQILDQLSENHSLVMLLSKHLSWGFVRNSLVYASGKDTPSIVTIFETMLQNSKNTYRSPELMMYMILELVSGTSYNAILYKEPVPLEELKAHLYAAIKLIFTQYQITEN
ncbi:TetR/AcrR family transcriptional regulator [Clostridium polynesiense]|uniref:TetR/AcrR family transcriptional regulator n=1 Tax=Clostridium polynesiense TaxID=1325933 RepID=UPI00058E7644|nr:TetR/AcrR family transcriptional regulator [Clostridium polynesiense]